MSQVEKTCTRCKEKKPLFCFNKNRRTHDGLRSACRQCQSELKAVYLKKKEQCMTPAKFEAKKNSINSQLRKVLESTPISEPWTALAIADEMRRVGSGAGDPRSTLGCLSSLVDQGMVEEVTKGRFKRVEIKEKQSNPEFKQIEAIQEPKEPEMQSRTIPAPPAANPIDKLSKLASRLRDLASDMETAALELAEQAERNEHETAKMRQLQALLKSLG